MWYQLPQLSLILSNKCFFFILSRSLNTFKWVLFIILIHRNFQVRKYKSVPCIPPVNGAVRQRARGRPWNINLFFFRNWYLFPYLIYHWLLSLLWANCHANISSQVWIITWEKDSGALTCYISRRMWQITALSPLTYGLHIWSLYSLLHEADWL